MNPTQISIHRTRVRRGNRPEARVTDMRELFERQAAWQARRRSLSWAEKLRMVEAVRESIIRLRQMRSINPEVEPADNPKPTRG